MGRSRRRQRTEAPDGGAHCRMCGARVPVGPDGRCRLGHRVRAAGAPPQAPVHTVDAEPGARGEHPPIEDGPTPAAQQPTPEGGHPAAVAEQPAAAMDDGPAHMPAADGRTEVADARPPQPRVSSPAAGPARARARAVTVDTTARHPYDDVLAMGPRPAPVAAPVAAHMAPTADQPRSALADLLSWDEPLQSALDVSIEELPAPPPPPPPEPAEAGVDHVPVEASDADAEAESDAEQTTRRGLTVLLGSGALALLALAILAVASAL